VTSEERARFEVLLERIDSKVNAIAEGQEATSERLERLEMKVDGVAEDVALVKMDVAAMKGRLGRVEGRLGRVEHHLGLNGAPAKAKRRRAPKRRN
jgi:hypothetical protein